MTGQATRREIREALAAARAGAAMAPSAPPVAEELEKLTQSLAAALGRPVPAPPIRTDDEA